MIAKVTGTFKVIIPARYASTRLPGKPLLEIGQKPLLQHVYESAEQSAAASVIIATDNAEIHNRAVSFGAPVYMTADTHKSGTERLIEVVMKLKEPDNCIIINLQGDEFQMPPEIIDQVAESLMRHPEAEMATLCEPITDVADYRNPNIVKVIYDRNHIALDFSREPVQWYGNGPTPGAGVYGYRHIGIYAYRAGFLKHYKELEPCKREKSERLEQLRVLEHGYRIFVDIAKKPPGIGIDTAEDLERARQLVENQDITQL